MNYIENKNQEQTILARLRKNPWEWVPLYIIKKWISQYNARIYWLRRKWYKIENKIEYKWKIRHTFFRILNN